MKKDAPDISNLSYDSFHGCYLEIHSTGLIHGGRQRSRESMSGLPYKK